MSRTPPPAGEPTAACLGLFPGSKVGIGTARTVDRIALALATERARGHAAAQHTTTTHEEKRP